MRRPLSLTRVARAAPAVVALAAALAVAPTPAGAKDGGGSGGGKGGRVEVRVAGTCGAGATVDLRLRGREGRIEVRLEVDQARPGGTWRIALVQERRVVWRGTARTAGSSASFEIERRLDDLPGSDGITVQAWGPKGLVCRATAVLPGS